MSTRAVAPVVAAPVAALTPLQQPMLQRTCDCGQHTGGGECEECKKKKMPLQRHANGSAAPAIAPPIVHDVLRSPGEPLDEDTQSHFAEKFRHDFSQVRVHTDEQAAESARAVSALAYTVGNHLVFGAGRYSPANGSGRRLLAHELTHVVQQQHESVPSPQYRLEIGPSQDHYEREADQLADRMASGMEASEERDSNLSLNPLSLTHQSPTPVAPRVQRAEASASAAPAPSPAAVPLLVEDDARDTHAGQMRKGEFLDKLQVSVCATADEVLSSVGRSAQGCPYIERWIGHLRTKKSQFVERGIRKYAPQSAGVTKAQDYIPFVTARVRRGVTRWTRTGEITEVPDELKGQLMGANLLAGVDRLLSGIGGGVGGAVSAIAGGVKKAASAIGGVFAKERDGGVRDAGDPHEIQAQLCPGHPLDAGVKSRMETAFGGDFSDVRAHTDSNAAELSTRLNARAFTVGRDVAFGAGEYQPGTLVGDALIAHELAHVMQQGNESSSIASLTQGGAEYNALEEDADNSAAGAVASLLGQSHRGLKNIFKNAVPSLRSGLKLQRCTASRQSQKGLPELGLEPLLSCTYDERNSADSSSRTCCTPSMEGEIDGLRSSGLRRVQYALSQLKSSPQSVTQQLQTHFLVKPSDTASVTRIGDQLQHMADAMQPGNTSVQYWCRDQKDKNACPQHGNLVRRAASNNCSSTVPNRMLFCGNYGASPYLGSGWLKTVIHEFAHVGCPPGGQILPAGSEFYQGVTAYPPPDAATAIKNADSYANFALDSSTTLAPGGAGQLSNMASMTAWQIAHLPDVEFGPPPSDEQARRRLSDFERTRRFARAIFAAYAITFDADADTTRVVGRDPTPQELQILNSQLSRILNLPGVQAKVAGPDGRGVPTAQGSAQPSMQRRVRVVQTPGEYGIKRYQLQVKVVGIGQNVAPIDALVKERWRLHNITADPNGQITEQERRAAILASFADNPVAPGFYNPIDDTIYLSHFVKLERPADVAVARHETVHFLGGREATRKAFVARYGATDYLRYWCIFEEGLAEMLSSESASPDEKKPSESTTISSGTTVTVEVTGAYEPEVAIMKGVVAKLGRDVVLGAYFSGNLPEPLFKLLEQAPATSCSRTS